MGHRAAKCSLIFVTGTTQTSIQPDEVLTGCHGDFPPLTILVSRGHCLGVWRRNAELKTLMYGVLVSERGSDDAVIAGCKDRRKGH